MANEDGRSTHRAAVAASRCDLEAAADIRPGWEGIWFRLCCRETGRFRKTPERRAMVQAWADYLDLLRKGQTAEARAWTRI